MQTETIVALITLIGTLAGTGLGIWSQRETKRLAGMERRIDRYKQEIRARQAGEDIACQWLVEVGAAQTHRTAMFALRQRTEDERGIRPAISPNEVAE